MGVIPDFFSLCHLFRRSFLLRKLFLAWRPSISYPPTPFILSLILIASLGSTPSSANETDPTCRGKIEDHATPARLSQIPLRIARKALTLEQRVERLRELIPEQDQALKRLEGDLIRQGNSQKFDSPQVQRSLLGYLYELRSLEAWVERRYRVEVLPYRNGVVHRSYKITDFVVEDVYVELKARGRKVVRPNEPLFTREFLETGTRVLPVKPAVRFTTERSLRRYLKTVEKPLLKRLRQASRTTRYSVDTIEGPQAPHRRALSFFLDFTDVDSNLNQTVAIWANSLQERFDRSKVIDADFILIEISLSNSRQVFFFSQDPQIQPSDPEFNYYKTLFSKPFLSSF